MIKETKVPVDLRVHFENESNKIINQMWVRRNRTLGQGWHTMWDEIALVAKEVLDGN